MTGRYAFRTGVTDNGHGAQATPQKDGCMALLMKQAGYATAVAGKQIPVSAEVMNPEAKAEKLRLQAALDALKSDEEITVPNRKNRKRKP